MNKDNTVSTVLVGGVGRSGTSILAKLLASSQEAELFYEPPVLMHLLEIMNDLPKEMDWSALFNTLINKELMKGAISGRALNLNKHDISSVYNYKSEPEIHARFKESFRQDSLDSLLEDKVALIKVLDNIHNYQFLKSYVENLKAVIIVRNPMDTCRSIMSKGWFSDDQLIEATSPARYMKIYRGYRIHAFLEETFYDEWLGMEEIDRITYYYYWHYNQFIEMVDLPEVYLVRYQDLLDSPSATAEKVLKSLKLHEGEKFSEILRTIRLQNTTGNAFKSVFSKSQYGAKCQEVFSKILARR
jgi:hypothetical protein